jgi:hypothetical protein
VLAVIRLMKMASMIMVSIRRNGLPGGADDDYMDDGIDGGPA